MDPRPWEPLFAAIERRGYRWVTGTEGAATARVSPDLPPTMALDWFLTRGVETGPVELAPAVGDDGSLISDHELIVLSGARMVS